METTKEIRKVNGKQYMTINAIAEASGIARDSLTNRFFRLKKAYPEHTCCFGSKIPVYYDEYVLYQLVRSAKTRPVRNIENMDKYKKFCKTYSSKACADQSDFALVEIAPVDQTAKEQPEQQSASVREETLSKLGEEPMTEVTGFQQSVRFFQSYDPVTPSILPSFLLHLSDALPSGRVLLRLSVRVLTLTVLLRCRL